MRKKVIVVGAGITGLTAAVYLQRSGFDVTLIEQHSIVGGMCTSWKRKGYLFEGAIHWLTGTSPKTQVHQIWKDTGALGEDIPVLLKDPFFSVEHDGQIISLYRDINKTVKNLISISPDDAPLLKKLAKDVKNISKMEMPIADIKGVKAKNPNPMKFGFIFKMLPALPVLRRLGKITCADFAMQLKHPGIQRLFRIVPDKYTATSLVFTLATLHTGDGGYPEGGSLAMVQRMAKTFTDLGGKLLLNTQVQRVNFKEYDNNKGDKNGGHGKEGDAKERCNKVDRKKEDSAGKLGTVSGVTIANETLNADIVIVTQETIAALDRLFDSPPTDEWITEMKDNLKPAVCTFISIGVRAELPDVILPEWTLDTPITFGDTVINKVSFYSYRQYAPDGGTALTTISFGDTYDFWKKAKDEGRYDEEKQALAEQFRRALCEKYPQCEGKIEVVDIATPLTYERYTGAYHGSWMSIMEPSDKMKQYPGHCKEIKGLYFAGHRLMPPGGLPSAAASGHRVAQQVCREFDVVFG